MADAMVDPAEEAGWAPYLDPGERLLWTGRPATGLRVRLKNLAISAFGLFFFGFAVFWTWMASGAGAFALFGIPFLAVGAYLVIGQYPIEAWKRARTRYALTDRRAFIASQAFGRSLKSWPIDPGAVVEFEPGEEASLWFARRQVRRGRRTHEEKIGFELIRDGDTAYRLYRAAQREIGAS